jgi:hypothetical protein
MNRVQNYDGSITAQPRQLVMRKAPNKSSPSPMRETSQARAGDGTFRDALRFLGRNNDQHVAMN